MGSVNASKIIKASGRVIINPTEEFKNSSFPYGGTEIGNTNLCLLRILGNVYHVNYESLGETGEILEANNSYIFACFLRGWDKDAIKNLFVGAYEKGPYTEESVFYAPGSTTPGQAVSSLKSVKLAYIPDDYLNVPGVIIYNAIPDFETEAEILFQRQTEFGLPLVFYCLRSSNNAILRIGKIFDLPLF